MDHTFWKFKLADLKSRLEWKKLLKTLMLPWTNVRMWRDEGSAPCMRTCTHHKNAFRLKASSIKQPRSINYKGYLIDEFIGGKRISKMRYWRHLYVPSADERLRCLYSHLSLSLADGTYKWRLFLFRNITFFSRACRWRHGTVRMR